MKKPYFIATLVLTAVIMLIAGCGTSSTPSATTTPATTSTPTVTTTATAQPTQTTTAPTTQTPTPTATPTTAAAPYGTLTAAVQSFGNEAMDATTQMESTWGWMMYDPLLRWNKDNQYVPAVAESYTYDGNVTFTFHIQQGIKFWNGDPLTANDVKFSVDRFGGANTTSPWGGYISRNMASSTVLNTYTYQFVEKHPEPALIIALAWTRILPEKYFNSVGLKGFIAKPMGSGPWMFQNLVQNQSITFEANTNYWDQSMVPSFKYYKELDVPEISTQIAMLQTGEVDMIQFPPPDKIGTLVKDGYTKFQMGVGGTCTLMLQGSWFPNAGPIGSKLVREAMSYAINRQQVVDTIFDGYGSVNAQFYEHPGIYGWTSALDADPYDPAKAKDLLKQANYPAAFGSNTVINMYTTQAMGPYGGSDLFLLIQSYWQAVGLQVKVHIVDQNTAMGYIFNGFSRMKGTEPNVGWVGCWNYDAMYNPTYQSANAYSDLGVHNTSNSVTATDMYNKAISDTNPAQAEKDFAAFEVYAKSMYVTIGVAETENFVVWNPKDVGGWIGNTWMSYWDSLWGVQHAK